MLIKMGIMLGMMVVGIWAAMMAAGIWVVISSRGLMVKEMEVVFCYDQFSNACMCDEQMCSR